MSSKTRTLTLAGSILLAAPGFSQLLDSGRLLPPDPVPFQAFGSSLSVSGDNLLVGALGDPDNPGGSGSAYAFSASSGAFVVELLPTDGVPLFGYKSAVSASHALIGVEFDDSNGNDAGSAYLFSLPSGQQIAKLLPLDGAAGDTFGSSVALSGDFAVVGAPQHDDSGSSRGAVYVFSVSTGQQVAKLHAGSGLGPALFGTSVAASGDLLLVGAPAESPGGVLYAGSAYVFSLPSAQQLMKLVSSTPEMLAYFGQAVALSGDTAVVGSPFGDDQGEDSGSAELFSVSTGQPLTKLMPIPVQAGDRFGSAVSITQNKVLVGAPYHDGTSTNSGAAYLFSVPTGQQMAQLQPSDSLLVNSYGSTMALSGAHAYLGFDTDRNGGIYPTGSVRDYDLTLPVNFGSAFGFGDGSGAACPCDAIAHPGEGCPNSSGRGARLTAFGNAFLSNDTFRLQVSGGPPNNGVGLVLRGNALVNGGFGNRVGDGLLCTTGQTARSQVVWTSSGIVTVADFRGSPFGASSYGVNTSTYYQFWYRDPANTCTGSNFNLSNAWTVDWQP